MARASLHAAMMAVLRRLAPGGTDGGLGLGFLPYAALMSRGPRRKRNLGPVPCPLMLVSTSVMNALSLVPFRRGDALRRAST